MDDKTRLKQVLENIIRASQANADHLSGEQREFARLFNWLVNEVNYLYEALGIERDPHSDDSEPSSTMNFDPPEHTHPAAEVNIPTVPPGIFGRPEGDRGMFGFPGIAGVAGAAGAAGATGAAGRDGVPGFPGQDGDRGFMALPGPKGDTGATGPQGNDGPPGSSTAGAAGPPGVFYRPEDGRPGFPGIKGDTGATGATGSSGSAGATGATGARGDAVAFRGEQGEPGRFAVPGERGATGATGATGNTGSTGSTGATGARGEALAFRGQDGERGMWVPGLKGDTGATGATGATGPAGSGGSGGGMPALYRTEDEHPFLFYPPPTIPEQILSLDLGQLNDVNDTIADDAAIGDHVMWDGVEWDNFTPKMHTDGGAETGPAAADVDHAGVPFLGNILVYDTATGKYQVRAPVSLYDVRSLY